MLTGIIELETELYNATVSRMELERNTEFQETISGFYDDMLESQLSLNSALYDFGDGFGEVGNADYTRFGVAAKYRF